MTNQLYSKKEKRFTAPALIPYFEDILRKKSNVTAEKAELLRQKYNANNNNKLEELAAEDFESDTQIEDVDFELRFEVQQKLKNQDQNQLEQELIQQDVDLMINFKNCI